MGCSRRDLHLYGCMEETLHGPSGLCTAPVPVAEQDHGDRAASHLGSSTKIHLSGKISLNCPTNHCYHRVSYMNLRQTLLSYISGEHSSMLKHPGSQFRFQGQIFKKVASIFKAPFSCATSYMQFLQKNVGETAFTFLLFTVIEKSFSINSLLAC